MELREIRLETECRVYWSTSFHSCFDVHVEFQYY